MVKNGNGHPRVLLVDDNATNLLALEVVLDGLPLHLVRASSGEEALSLLEANDYAVVLMDVRMPGMDGFEAARRLRANERSRFTPIMFLTAADDDAAKSAEAYALGATDYLVKPYTPAVVRAKVTALASVFAEKEQARREADQLRLLVQGTTDYAILMLDPNGYIASWNVGAERIKGYRADEIVGKHFTVFYPEDAVARGWPQEELRRAIADGRFEDEGWRVRKDGSKFWANVIITALRDDDGRLRGFSKLTRNLTERREREEAVKRLRDELEVRVKERTAELAATNEALRRENEERTRAEEEVREKQAELTDFVENATVGLHWVGPDGTILWANRAEHELLGYTREEYVGRNIADFHADPPVIDDILCRLTRGEELYGYEARLRCKDGTVRHVLISSSVYRKNGEFCHTRCFTRDITERKAAEEALKERDRRKDEFMAMLAHELRNPLAPISNALQILQLRKDEETVEQVRQMVGRQVGQLNHLVSDLLEASRVTTGKIVLRKQLLDLAQFARIATNDVADTLKTAGINLTVEAPDTPVWVDGDWTRLTQALGNLLHNSGKFTAAGGQVTVTVEASEGMATLSVNDTGAGIAPEVLPRLFSPFTQATQDLDRSKGGLGLGLALVKGLVELHGGTVRAESDGPGRGARLTIELPLAEEPAAFTGANSKPGYGPARKLRVLVVEDNRDSADSLKMALEMGGCCQVTVAYNGPDGVEVAKKIRPDLVLCDIGLPGYSGYEVARRIRKYANGSVVLVALTGYGRDEDRAEAKAAGFDRHFTKPIDFTQLEAIISTVA
jgi:PAS domain S-box-containing protein